MSTRSYIGIENEDSTVSYIYCHSDGYPEHNGKMMWEHYQERAKVYELVGLGNVSYIDEEVNPDPNKEHSFDYDKRQKGVTVAYHRDRGEKWEDNKPGKADSIKKLAEEALANGFIEWLYILTKENEWIVYNCGTKKPRKRSLWKVLKIPESEAGRTSKHKPELDYTIHRKLIQ